MAPLYTCHRCTEKGYFRHTFHHCDEIYTIMNLTSERTPETMRAETVIVVFQAKNDR